jgi:hypothetical protein
MVRIVVVDDDNYENDCDEELGYFNSISISTIQTRNDDNDAFEFSNDADNSEYDEIMESIKATTSVSKEAAIIYDGDEEVVNYDDI